MTPSERDMPIKELVHLASGWYQLPTFPGPSYVPDKTSALAAARELWPYTAFRIVDETSGAALPDVPGGTPYPEGTRHRPVVDRARAAAATASSSPRRQRETVEEDPENVKRARWGDR